MEYENPSLIRSTSSSEATTIDSRQAQFPVGAMGAKWEGFSVSVPDPALNTATVMQELQSKSPSTYKELQPQPSCIHASGRDSRQARVHFTDDVRMVLEAQFKKDQYPDKEEKEKLLKCTRLTIKQINTWFANKRAKAKKQSKKKKVEATQLSYAQHLRHQTLSTGATITEGSSPFFGTGSLCVCPSVLQSEDANLEFPVPYGISASQEAQEGQCGTSSLTGNNLRNSSAVPHDKPSESVKIFGQWVEKPPFS